MSASPPSPPRPDDEGSTRVRAEGSTRVDDEGSTRVGAEGSTRVDDEGSTRVDAEGSTRVRAEGSTRVRAEVRTHARIDAGLCGEVVEVAPGRAELRMTTLPVMVVDDAGLVHGGFVFGLADHAAMLAVNDPNVVLGAATTRFLKPLRVGEVVVARASVTSEAGRKRGVAVEVLRGEEPVMTGEFTCFVLDRHVLSDIPNQ